MKNFAVWLIYFSLILVFAMPKGLETELSNSRGTLKLLCPTSNTGHSPDRKSCEPSIFALATATDYVREYGQMDMASYVKGALKILDSNLLLSPKLAGWKLREYGYGMWAPGIFFINGAALSFDRDIPFGLFHLLLASVLWAITFLVINLLLRRQFGFLSAFILPRTAFLLPLFSSYFFSLRSCANREHIYCGINSWSDPAGELYF